ncbi:hypothetical protein BN439_3475 [Erwinia amylovora Ea644]|uniref:Uncharacterized protein n=3 Tax=Erwinia amylovora TaxID=552 RepID=A0A831A1B3_ERWAM|nr:hypothetical protein EaACW_3237 [Erwinia amylovora ACW56400]QJQ53107.1 hypothetical protein EHX00_0400 [Erwinia amylovora]CBA23238.1 hypothetical protein predicted by Glimmer/Critica [Erwinia amylovora CFBP1430]CBX82098.1 hypothetical protein predicted by Glimmer/Critica [Erwinia amylovora ATCC BAA-2158]CCO80076.1 hypothetical protein BN432_3306 [Erwinia amylovora Ea356]CCO83880.1 hypothetical protein BN433_3332 [Erwinia amylovora Ea266]CCO87642.1 hypothetical protein BN434_3282 [Erwinia a
MICNRLNTHHPRFIQHLNHHIALRTGWEMLA